MVRINIGEDYDESMKSSTEDFETLEIAANFLLIVNEWTRDNSTFQPSKGLIDDVANLAAFQYRPKYLLLLGTRVSFDNLEEFLQYTWTKKLLDLTIVELTEHVDYTIDSPIIHRLNPFKNEYERIKWTFDVEWFPKKDDDMWGYPLRIKAVNLPPFTNAEFNEFREPIKVYGANIVLLEDIAKRLNLSVKYLAPSLVFNDIGKYSDPSRFIHDATEYDKIDVDSYLTLHLKANKYNTLRTKTIIFDPLCPVVPILPKVKIMPVSVNFFKACLLSFGVVLIFRIITHVFKFDSRPWQTFNVARLLFGVSVERKPTKIMERIIFGCLIIVSSIYSSAIYSDITDVSLQTFTEMELESFEDLDNSGLIPIISPYTFAKTFDSAKGALNNLKDKTILSSRSMYQCALFAAKEKNITCLMSRQEAELAIERSKIGGRAMIKIVKPCFWFDARSFVVGERSPYRPSIDRIIMRLHASGLIEKLYRDENIIPGESNDDAQVLELGIKESMISLRRQLIAIGIIGYAISLLVFIAEVVVDRVSTKYIKSKNFKSSRIP